MRQPRGGRSPFRVTDRSCRGDAGIIGCYRRDNIASNALFSPTQLRGIPPHSHSIVPGGFEVMS
jgi:hypothetical protein